MLLTPPISLKEQDSPSQSRGCAVSNIPAGNQLTRSKDWNPPRAGGRNSAGRTEIRVRDRYSVPANPRWPFEEKSLYSAPEPRYSDPSWRSTTKNHQLRPLKTPGHFLGRENFGNYIKITFHRLCTLLPFCFTYWLCVFSLFFFFPFSSLKNR